jgi:dihydroorotate dehydrogenase (NAD+) catalytic subunit
MVDLKVKIDKLELKNPVTTASGTYGYGEEYVDFMDVNRLAAIFVKGITLENREGNPYPRMAETASGMLNSVGLQNKGVTLLIQFIRGSGILIPTLYRMSMDPQLKTMSQ